MHAVLLQVAFDPLDGSSIVGANFAVGSIFGVWPGDQLLGQKAGDQVAACYGIYGPKTLLVLAFQCGELPCAYRLVMEMSPVGPGHHFGKKFSRAALYRVAVRAACGQEGVTGQTWAV